MDRFDKEAKKLAVPDSNGLGFVRDHACAAWGRSIAAEKDAEIEKLKREALIPPPQFDGYALRERAESAERQLAACKKAKTENDDRFMTERDAARRQLAECREALKDIADQSFGEYDQSWGDIARKALAGGGR